MSIQIQIMIVQILVLSTLTIFSNQLLTFFDQVMGYSEDFSLLTVISKGDWINNRYEDYELCLHFNYKLKHKQNLQRILISEVT